MTADFASIMNSCLTAMNAKGAAWSEADAVPYVHEKCFHNGKPLSRAEMAAGGAAPFASSSNKIAYGYELITVEENVGKTEDGKAKHKTVGWFSIIPMDADGKQVDGPPVLREEITHIWVDGKVLETYSGEAVQQLEAEMGKTVGKAA